MPRHLMASMQLERVPPGPETPFDAGFARGGLETLHRLFRRHGDIYRLLPTAGAPCAYVASHPDMARQVLATGRRRYVKGTGIERVRILLGNGLMTSEGEFWQRQRRMVQGAFHRRVVARFGEVMAAGNEALAQAWARKAEGREPVNLTEDVSRLAAHTVVGALFGEDLPRLRGWAGGVDPFAILTDESARDLQFARRFRELAVLVRRLVAERRACGVRPTDILSMLLDARDAASGEAMSEREVVDEAMTLIVAGHETTASALNWCWYLLSQHPAAEARLHREVDGGAAPRVDNLSAYPYTRHVVEETLRLYPPGWLLTRRAVEDDVLGGYPVPAGADVWISPYLIHRHPRFWAEPEAFRPERFETRADERRHSFAYLPFAAGPRRCVGDVFALVEMQLHLAGMARRFRLRPLPSSPPVEPEARVNLRTRQDIHMHVEIRS